jgi:hypothetical protein
VETLLKRFPQLAPAQVLDALAFAFDNQEVVEADLAREAEMLKRLGQKLPARPSGPEQIELPFAASSAGDGQRRSGRGRR